MVKWISQSTSDRFLGVRILLGAPKKRSRKSLGRFFINKFSCFSFCLTCESTPTEFEEEFPRDKLAKY